jgi:hypothetical protein
MADMAGAEILPNTAEMVVFLVVRQILLRLRTQEMSPEPTADVVRTLVAQLVMPRVLTADVALSMGKYISLSYHFQLFCKLW